MAILPPMSGPSALLADLRAFVRSGEHRHKLLFAALSVAITGLWVFGFIIESRWGILPKGPQITYAMDFPANRTDEEIVAQNIKDQKAKDAALAERRRQWQKLDKALTDMGI